MEKEDINWILKWAFGVIVVICGFLTWCWVAFGVSNFYTESFETYSIGDLNKQNNWEASPGHFGITSTQASNGLKSAETGGGYAVKNIGTTTGGYLEFDVLFGTTTNNDDFSILSWKNATSSNHDLAIWSGRIYRPNNANYVFYGFAYGGSDHWINTTTIAINTWYNVKINYVNDQTRMNFNSLGWSDFYQYKNTGQTNWDFLEFYLSGSKIFIDDINIREDELNYEYHNEIIDATPHLFHENQLTPGQINIRDENYLYITGRHKLKITTETNSYEEEYDPDQLTSYFKNDFQLYLNSNTYELWKWEKNTTSTLIATSTNNFGQTATKGFQCSYNWNSSSQWYDETCYTNFILDEATSTMFNISSLTPGIYYLVSQPNFSTSTYFDVDLSNTWNETWIFKLVYDSTTDDWHVVDDFDPEILQNINITPEEAKTRATSTMPTQAETEAQSENWIWSKIINYVPIKWEYIVDLFTDPNGLIKTIIDSVDIRKKVPISYLFEIRNIVKDQYEGQSSLTATSTYFNTSTYGVLNVSFGSNSVSYRAVDFGSIKYNSNYANAFALLRTIIKYSLWLSFIWWCYATAQTFLKT